MVQGVWLDRLYGGERVSAAPRRRYLWGTQGGNTYRAIGTSHNAGEVVHTDRGVEIEHVWLPAGGYLRVHAPYGPAWYVGPVTEEFASISSSAWERAHDVDHMASPAAQHPEPSDALLSFLRSVDGCVDCDPDGTVRLIFCEETRVPLAVIEEAVAHLQAHDPAGRVSVVADGGIVVELRPAVAAEEVGE